MTTRLGFIAPQRSCTALGQVEADFSPQELYVDGKPITINVANEAKYHVKRTIETDRFFESARGHDTHVALNTGTEMFLLTGISHENKEINGTRVTTLFVNKVQQTA